MVAKVEWHQGELFPRVGFIVTNMSAKPEGVVLPDGDLLTHFWCTVEGITHTRWVRLSPD